MRNFFVIFLLLISVPIYGSRECAKGPITRNEFCTGEIAYDKEGNLVLLLELKKGLINKFKISIIGKNDVETNVLTRDLFYNKKQKNVKAEVLGDLGTDIITRLTPKQISALSAVQIRSLKPIHLNRLFPRQIQSLTKQQIESLKSDQIKALTPNQMKGFTPEQIVYLRASFEKFFTAEQVKALSDTFYTKMDQEQLKKFLISSRHVFQSELIARETLLKLKPKLLNILKDESTSDYLKYSILKKIYKPKQDSVICFVKSKEDLGLRQPGVTTAALKEIFERKNISYDGILQDFNLNITKNDFLILKEEIKKNKSLDEIFKNESFWKKVPSMANFRYKIKSNIINQKCTTLIFPGGQDINKDFYSFLISGDAPQTNISESNLGKSKKDKWENEDALDDLFYFISIFLAKEMNKSIITFCRGFQALGIYFGGKLVHLDDKFCKLTQMRFSQKHPSFQLAISGKENKEILFCHNWYVYPFPNQGNMLATYQREGKSIPALAEYYSKTGLRFFGTQGHPEGFFSSKEMKHRTQFGKVLFMELLKNAGVFNNLLEP